MVVGAAAAAPRCNSNPAATRSFTANPVRFPCISLAGVQARSGSRNATFQASALRRPAVFAAAEKEEASSEVLVYDLPMPKEKIITKVCPAQHMHVTRVTLFGYGLVRSLGKWYGFMAFSFLGQSHHGVCQTCFFACFGVQVVPGGPYAPPPPPPPHGRCRQLQPTFVVYACCPYWCSLWPGKSGTGIGNEGRWWAHALSFGHGLSMH